MQHTVDLSASRVSQSAEDVFRGLAAACHDLSIASFETYGDYGKTSSTSWYRSFEAEVAAHLGKPDALFLPSGVMAQLIALCIHRADRPGAPSRFICHHTSHLCLHEEEGYAALGLHPVIVGPEVSAAVQRPMTLGDVAEAFTRLSPLTSAADADVCAVLLELPHREVGGKCTSFADIEALSVLCRSKGAALHMDGARLWEAQAAYSGKTLAEARNE